MPVSTLGISQTHYHFYLIEFCTVLKIYIRHLQYYDDDGQPFVYGGANPSSLSVIYNTVPISTWQDVTNDVEGLKDLGINWKEQDSEFGHIQTGISASLEFYGEAYKFVKAWLNDHVAAPLNAIDVRIEDVNCAYFEGFCIKADGMKWCNDTVCNIEVTLKQQEPLYDCIRRTAIADNWQGWFQKDTTKKHPRIAYCDEFRPSGILTAIFVILSMISNILYLMSIILLPICSVLKTLGSINIFGFRPFKKLKNIQCGVGAVTDILSDLTEVISGCNRAMPSPLVRDYIKNVCDKCGVQVNALSIPLFFDPASDYYNLTYLSADVKRGVLIKKNVYWTPENEPIKTLDMLLDDLKAVFNAKWRIINGVLNFKYKEDFIIDETIFYFPEVDEDQLLSNICYEWNGEKKPAYVRGIYSKDAIDTIANTAGMVMNDIVDYNNPNNPMLEGQRSIISQFGMQRYMWDGIEVNYLSEALAPTRAILVGLNALALIGLNQIIQKAKSFRGYLIMKSDQTSVPKLIIWDGVDTRIAKAVYKYEYKSLLPVPNTFYNTDTYDIVHEEDYDDYYNYRGRLYNYPMFFDAKFKGNLYERFWQSEDPRLQAPLNKTWEVEILNCCDNVKRLGLSSNAENIKIGAKVKLFATGFYSTGTLTEIEIKYGRSIKLKGKL